MIEQIARFPRVRDRAVFVGSPDDIVPAPSDPTYRSSETGPRATTTSQVMSRASIRVSSKTEAPSDTGRTRRSASSRLAARGRCCPAPPGHCLLPAGEAVGTGPANDRRGRAPNRPRTLPSYDGLEIRAYVHELYRHLAVYDLAVVQGGLTTAMELTASRRPFLYFPSSPLRAELPRTASSQPLRRRPLHGLRHRRS